MKGRARFSDRPAPPRALSPVGALFAGAVDVDITPPPGMPKAGYSANAHNGSGFRTRLRARIIHLRTDTASIALVQCDLLGGSAVVQHLVAAAIADETDVPLAGVFVGATHTHAGPGQYLGTDFYNRFASNQAGFDPGYTQFLVDQISGGIIAAVTARQPARLAFGTTEVWGLTRNRSLGAHIRNDSVTDTSTPAQRKFHAVNPELHLLRVDTVVPAADATTPLAAMVVFSVHGTGVPMQADEYNADIWAYLVGELKLRVDRSTGTTPVIGAVEGTHADVAPAIRPGAAGHLEAARVGRAVGAEAAALYDRLGAELREDVELAAGLREVDLAVAPTIDGTTLANRPAVGAALVAGAHENLTPVVHRIPPFAAGHPKRWGTDNPQGVKWVIGSRWLQPIVLPLKTFPRVLPVQVLRFGSTWFVGLPFELTVETGRLIAKSVATALDADPDVDADLDADPGDTPRIIVSSVANEYSGYAATAHEYELQCYEGAHTLYGPNTQPFLAAQAARLATEVQAATLDATSARPAFVQDVLAERTFDLKLVHHLPRADPAARAGALPRRFDGAAEFIDPTRSTDGFWQAEWLDVAPAELHWHEPIVHVEASDDAGESWGPAERDERTVDDQGWDLQVTAVGATSGGAGHRYRVRWWDPAFKRGRSFRFVLADNNGRAELASPAFR